MEATTVVIQLNVRPDWIIPKILSTSSPQDNENILDAGCRVLTTSKSESAGLSQKDLKEKLERHWINENNDLKQKLKTSEVARLLAEKTTTTLTDSVEERISNVTEASRKANQKANKKEYSKLNDLIETLKEKCENLSEQLRDEQVKSLSNEKELTISLTKEKEKEKDELRNEHKTEMDELRKEWKDDREKIIDLQSRKLNSSIKGQNNEDRMLTIISNSFGKDNSYKLIGTASGGLADLRFKWLGYKVMNEFKETKEQSHTASHNIPKAHSDFLSNKKFDCLLYYSWSSTIPNKLGYGEIGYEFIGPEQNKPVIYIGNLGKNVDPIFFINSCVIPFTYQLIKISKEKNQEQLVNLNETFEKLTVSINETTTNIDDFTTHFKELKTNFTKNYNSCEKCLNLIKVNHNNNLNSLGISVKINDAQSMKFITPCGKGGAKKDGVFTELTRYNKHLQKCQICIDSKCSDK